MRRQDQMKLGTFVYTFGYHPAGWLHPGSDVGGANDFSHLHKVAQISEAAKFDFLFMADSPAAAVGDPEALARMPTKMNRFEPLSLLSALAVTTRNLGLVGTASTSYYEPFNLARIFASIDHLSGGRACWNVVTSDHDETGYNFNRTGLDPHADRYARAKEFVDVVFGLWDSFEDDALLLDRERGLYHDPSKHHALDHVGPHFQVRGPLNIARTPQGRPVIAQAGGSDAGIELAAETAELVFGLASNIDRSRSFYATLEGPDGQVRARPGCSQGHARLRGQCRAHRGRSPGQGGLPARPAAPRRRAADAVGVPGGRSSRRPARRAFPDGTLARGAQGLAGLVRGVGGLREEGPHGRRAHSALCREAHGQRDHGHARRRSPIRWRSGSRRGPPTVSS